MSSAALPLHALAALDTACPFASLARYQYLESGALSLSSLATQLGLFLDDRTSHEETVWLAHLGVGLSIDRLAAVVNTILRLASPASDLDAEISSKAWRLYGQSAPMFAIVLSDAYPSEHPRFSSGGSYLCVQPEALFDRVRSKRADRVQMSRQAERAFRVAGKPYQSAHQAGVPKALRILQDSRGHGIRWWEVNVLHGDELIN